MNADMAHSVFKRLPINRETQTPLAHMDSHTRVISFAQQLVPWKILLERLGVKNDRLLMQHHSFKPLHKRRLEVRQEVRQLLDNFISF